jgi:transcriptional regulator with XRE-family HTH domain
MDAKKIKTERLQLGISQQKMAERLGVTRRTIINYETGVTHVPDTVTKLHNCLKRNDIIERERAMGWITRQHGQN